MMKLIKQLIFVVLAVAVLLFGILFSLKNNQPIVLDMWLFELPPIWLSFLMVGAFVIGGFFGFFIAGMSLVKTKTEKGFLKRKLKKIEDKKAKEESILATGV